MDTTIQQAIRNRAADILSVTNHIRDIFPDDLPYLWDTLSVEIEKVETLAHSIREMSRA